MRNDFEFGFLKAHDWGIVGAVIVALALIAFPLIALHELSPWKVLAAALVFYAPGVRMLFSPTQSSPAEQAERSEGKGTQVETQARSPRIGRAKLSKGKQVSTPGSAKYADAVASLARANGDVPTVKQRAARARRG